MRLYRQNIVVSNGTLKNAPSEDANFPASNAKLRSRFRFYRSGITPGTPVNFDYDNLVAFGIKSVGLANIRAYRGTVGITSLEMFYGTGSVYPPTWVQILTPQTVTTIDNDLMWDITPTTARFWRFQINNAGQFSMKPWIVKTTDVVDLQEGFNMREAVRRIRAPEKPTLLGSVVFTDLGVGKAQTITEWTFKDTASSTQKSAALAAQNGRDNPNPIFRDIYGRHLQVTPLDPLLKWRRSGITIATRVEMGQALGQLP